MLPFCSILGAVLFFLALIDTWKRKFSQIVNHSSSHALAIIAVSLIIITILAQNPLESLIGLTNFLPYFLMFGAYRLLIQTLSQLYQLAWIIVLPSVLVSILGLGQIFAHWKTHPFISLLLGWELLPGGNPPGRMASVFMYANILAVYLLIAFTFSLGLLLLEIKTNQTSRNRKQNLILLIFATAINGISTILTYSRSAWIILILIILSYTLYFGWRWMALMLSGIVGIVLGAAYAPSPWREPLRQIVPMYFWARITDQLYLNRPIPLLRITQWNFAFSMIQERPLFGWGLRNFTALYLEKTGVFLGHPHNLFLMLGAETGLISSILFVGFVGWFYVQAMFCCFSQFKRGSSEQILSFTYLVAFAAITLFNVADVTVFDIRMNGFSWLLLSSLAGLANAYSNSANDQRVPSSGK